jgi:ankyrin repeat protein
MHAQKHSDLSNFIFHGVIRQKTPLHFCAGNGFLEACRLLVHYRADVSARMRCRSLHPRAPPFSPRHSLRCSDGRTALDRAMKTDVQAFLRSLGAPE